MNELEPAAGNRLRDMILEHADRNLGDRARMESMLLETPPSRLVDFLAQNPSLDVMTARLIRRIQTATPD